jgi:hypothetical protein
MQDRPKYKKGQENYHRGFPIIYKVSSGSIRLVTLTDPICSAKVQSLRILSTHMLSNRKLKISIPHGMKVYDWEKIFLLSAQQR